MTKIVLLVAIAYLFILFFRFQGRFIMWVAESITAEIVLLLIRIGMALLTGWMIYISIAILGMMNRIRSIDDILTILQARPSQIGGSASLGLWIGLIFAFFTFRFWSPYNRPSVIQGQSVQFESFSRRVTIVGWIRRAIQRRLK